VTFFGKLGVVFQKAETCQRQPWLCGELLQAPFPPGRRHPLCHSLCRTKRSVVRQSQLLRHLKLNEAKLFQGMKSEKAKCWFCLERGHYLK